MTASEFIRIVKLSDLERGPISLKIQATKAERAALARRFGLMELERLEADVEVRPDAIGYAVTGEVRGRALQACRITLEPVEEAVAASIETLLGCSGADSEMIEGELDLDAAGLDIEEVVGGSIDIGELAAQVFALALDPYPRAPGAVLDTKHMPKRSNPFENLRDPKEKG